MSSAGLLAVLLVSISLGASTQGIGQSTAQFHSRVNLVEVDVSVVDRDGRPVTDLVSSDFQVLEDGRPQTIQAMYLATADSVLLAQPAPTRPAESAATPAVIVPGRRALAQRLYVFVIDEAHLSAAGFRRTREAIESFLRDGLTPADAAGIVAGGQMLGKKLQSDAPALLAELAGVPQPNLARFNEMRTFPRILSEQEAALIARGDAGTIEAAVRRGCAERPGDCSGRAGDEPVRVEVEGKARQIAAAATADAQATLNALQTLTSGLSRFPGPKQVVVFSEGFYTDDIREWLHQLVGVAAQSGVRFSTLDARGLNRDPRMQNVDGAQPLTSPGELTSIDTDASADALASLALDTGGELIRNRNDLRPALDLIARETGTYYVLGYTPDRPIDRQYHRIAVTVARPGVAVRARRGYVERPVDQAAPAGAEAPSSPMAVTPPAAAAHPPAGAETPPVAAAPPTITTPASVPEAVRMRAERIGELAGRESTGSGRAAEANQLALDGWQLYGQGDVDGAQQKLQAAASTGAASPWIYYALGQAEYALNHFEAAVKAWETVHARMPDYEPVYFDLTDGYLQLSRRGDAVTLLREATHRWPADPETHNALGVMLVRRNALDDAIAEFDAATKADPTDGLGFFNLGRTYHLRLLHLIRSAGQASASAARLVGERDRQRAIDNYKRYLEIGGLFEKEARDAISLLSWK